MPICKLCGVNQLVKETDDRCAECYENTCARCGEESNGDYCSDCGYVPKD